MNTNLQINENKINPFNKNGRELQELLGSTSNPTKWATDQIERFDLEEGKDFIPSKEKSTGGRPKTTYFFTEEAAHRIASHSEVKSDNAIMVKDNMAVSNLALQGNKQAIIMQAIMFLQNDLEEAQKELKIKNKEIKTLKPMADYATKVLASPNSFPVSVIAQELNYTPEKLNKILEAMKIQYKRGKRWYLSAKYLGKGYTDEKTFITEHGISHTSMRWTQKGKKFVIEEINKVRDLIKKEQMIITNING